MARRRRTKVQRVVNLVKKFIAFCFSHVGLSAVVIGYALLGAVVFRAIEGPHETDVQRQVVSSRRLAVDVAWNATFKLNILDGRVWHSTFYRDLRRLKKDLILDIRRGYDGKELGISSQWTFSGAFLYSLTVITTIGYGNIACKTYFGKTVTIMYAIMGIPLMLLFLTNIGDVLAKVFKFLYSRTLRLKIRLVQWHRKRKHARLRRMNSNRTRTSNRSGYSYRDKDRDRLKYDSSQESFVGGPGDLDELLSARQELEQLSLKESAEERLSGVTVPLSLVLLTMVAYLISGAILFCIWEGWNFLAAFYFCYISLTTIGFGDLFPGASVSDDAEAQEKLVICSLYLLLGMALIAMCFNLAQEEVVNKVSNLATKIGVVKHDDDYD